MNEFERTRRNMLLNSSDPRSWLVKTDGTVIYFEMENTPVENFCMYSNQTSSLIVNGAYVTKSTIKEIVFGDSYSVVTNIGGFFLYDCRSLTSIDLSGLAGAESVGYYFKSNESNTAALTTIIIGDKDWSSVYIATSNFQYNSAGAAGTIYAKTTDLAAAFRNKFSDALSQWNVSAG